MPHPKQSVYVPLLKPGTCRWLGQGKMPGIMHAIYAAGLQLITMATLVCHTPFDLYLS
jgi:hypothetical protein